MNEIDELMYGMHEWTAWMIAFNLSDFLSSSIDTNEQSKLTSAGEGVGRLNRNMSTIRVDKEKCCLQKEEREFRLIKPKRGSSVNSRRMLGISTFSLISWKESSFPNVLKNSNAFLMYVVLHL